MAESPTPFAEIDHGPSKLDLFLDAHQKKLIATAILLAIGVIAYVIYSGIAKGEAEDAGAALLTAEKPEAYQEVIDKWSTSKAAASAMPLMADTQGEKSPEKAIETLKSFIDNHSDHPTVDTAKVNLALRLLEQGKTSEAKEILTDVADNESDSYIAPLAFISLGDIAKAEGKKDEAKTWYEKATEDPTAQGNTYADAATNRLALVNALPPKKVKPAAPAPVVAPKAATPVPAVVPPVPKAPATPKQPIKVTPQAEAPKTEAPAPETKPAEKKTESEAPAAQ